MVQEKKKRGGGEREDEGEKAYHTRFESIITRDRTGTTGDGLYGLYQKGIRLVGGKDIRGGIRGERGGGVGWEARKVFGDRCWCLS